MISSSCKCCSMVGRKNKKPFVAPADWQKRRKAENPPRYHSSSFPLLETHSTGYHHIPASVTGAPVCIYSWFNAAAIQPVQQLDRTVPCTNRHFSERVALLTTLCHRVCDGCMIAKEGTNVNRHFPDFSIFCKSCDGKTGWDRTPVVQNHKGQLGISVVPGGRLGV